MCVCVPMSAECSRETAHAGMFFVYNQNFVSFTSVFVVPNV